MAGAGSIFLDLNLDSDVKEPEAVDPGQYKLAIVSVEELPNKAGTGINLVARLSILSDEAGQPVENAPLVYHYMSLPKAEDEPRTRNFKGLQIKRWCEAFSVPFNGNEVNYSAAVGLEADATLRQDTQDQHQNEIDPRNSVSRFLKRK